MRDDLKTVFITGASGAIGGAIADQIALNPAYRVVLVVRDPEKGSASVERITRASGNPRVSFEVVDLSSRDSIHKFSERWKDPLFALVNNAVTAPKQRQETQSGIEMQLATNVLGYLWMTVEFTRQLKSGAPARVVNVASNYAGDLDLDDLEFKRRHYNNHEAYRQSKQANRMLTVALGEQLEKDGIVVNACHPGVVNSKLTQALSTRGWDSPDEGARTAVWLVADPKAGGYCGKYFVNQRVTKDRFAEDRHAINKLFELCSAY